MYNGVDEFVIFPRSLLHFKQISVHKIYKLFSDEKNKPDSRNQLENIVICKAGRKLFSARHAHRAGFLEM